MGHYLFNDNLIIKLKNKYFPIFFFLSFFFYKGKLANKYLCIYAKPNKMSTTANCYFAK